MPSLTRLNTAPQSLAYRVQQWLAGWWRIVHLGAVLLVLTLSPSTWRGESRAALARQLHIACTPLIPWFTLLSTIISVVLARLVIVTAMSYGLSRFALQTVVRMLVLELLPITTAVFVAIRCAMPQAQEIGA